MKEEVIARLTRTRRNFAFAGKRPAPFARAAAFLLLSALGMAGWAGCAPKEQHDCTALISDRQYETVIESCQDPADVAMGYLGLAGFDFLEFVSADDPGNLLALLNVDADNITTKRELVNSAVRNVAGRDTSLQAFVLLLSGFVGLNLTLHEFLDNGAGGATPLDNVLQTLEVESALGLTVRSPAPAVPFALDASTTFAVVAEGAPYVVSCGSDVSPPICDGSDAVTSYDDEEPVRGAGLDVTDTSADTPPLAEATDANQIVMLLSMDLPITVDVSKLVRAGSFLGGANLDPSFPAENEDLFPIGMLGYLNLVDAANETLAEAAGTGDGGGSADGGSDGESTQSTLNRQIDSLRAALDNGAFCFKGTEEECAEQATEAEQVECQAKTAAAIPLSILYAIYQVTPGTAERPVPADGDFTDLNIVPRSELDTDGDFETDDPSGTEVKDGEMYEFGGGELEVGYKILFPDGGAVLAFDRSRATPRMDETEPAFRNSFELLPRIAPNAMEAADRDLDLLEILCISSANPAEP